MDLVVVDVLAVAGDLARGRERLVTAERAAERMVLVSELIARGLNIGRPAKTRAAGVGSAGLARGDGHAARDGYSCDRGADAANPRPPTAGVQSSKPLGSDQNARLGDP